MRSMAQKEAGTGNKMLAIWDFVVHRDDGTGLRLHPRRTTTWIDTIEVEGHREQVPPPSGGFGASDGPGTCRKYKNIAAVGRVRFNPRKAPLSAKSGKDKKNKS